MDIAKPLADEPRLAGFAGRDAALRRPRPRFPGFWRAVWEKSRLFDVEC